MHWKSLKNLEILEQNCQNCPKIWRKINSRNKCIEKASKNVQKFENVAKSWQISNAKMSKMSKNLKKCWTIWKLENLAKSWQNSIWKLEKCPKIWKNDEKLDNLAKYWQNSIWELEKMSKILRNWKILTSKIASKVIYN